MCQHWDLGRVELEVICSICRVVLPSTIDAKGIILEGDCKNVLDFCGRSLQRSAWRNPIFMEQDLSFLAELNQVLLRHIPREANRLADFCAKLGMSNDFVWTDVVMAPPEFLEILQKYLEWVSSV
ncbi:hypothetical protein KSP40_PGU002638 [Platanthera guangdongensis]|uniref:RNase H type-1 domain-containing protein n=1 Tax=Platanthera guangdongensis TaxID=2320717 RepID=A0ABR2LYL5_9ASPA